MVAIEDSIEHVKNPNSKTTLIQHIELEVFSTVKLNLLLILFSLTVLLSHVARLKDELGIESCQFMSWPRNSSRVIIQDMCKNKILAGS